MTDRNRRRAPRAGGPHRDLSSRRRIEVRLARCLSPSLVAGICLLSACPKLDAADWPQWRFDANRSAATEEPGPGDEPSLLWRQSLGPPDPAYDHQYRMCADAAYAPVAAEGWLFLPSNTADQVTAWDLETGQCRWRFFAQAPVRFAPLYRSGRVYFVADDGFLYCVSAREGTLVWKLRGAPPSLPDCWMLVNGRMSSRWPCRGAPVETDGVIYFGAGIWPEEGVYVSAVDAETGQLRWRSDRMSYVERGMSDHGRAYDLSLPPQGYLAIIDGRLAVPSGRSLAAWFDPDSGEMEPYTCFYVKTNPPRGTWYLAGIERFAVQGGNWFGTRPDAAPLPPQLRDAKPAIYWSKDTPENERYVIEHRPFLRADAYRLHNENRYTEPVLTATAVYASELATEPKYLVPRGHTRVAFPPFDYIVARDLTRPRWTSAEQNHLAYGGRPVQVPKLEFPGLWKLESPLRVLIKAGDRLYAGGENTIAAIAIPAAGESPRVAWQAAVDGTPVEALVADRKLVVVTDTGEVSCFAAGESVRGPGDSSGDATNTGEAEPGASDASGDPSHESGDKPAEGGGVPKDAIDAPQAYACLIGWNGVERAAMLVREHGDRVIVLEPDAARAAEARQELAREGLYGQRVQVIEASPLSSRLAPYWASRIAIASADRFGPPEAVFSALLELLRPYSGKLFVVEGRQHAELLERLVRQRSGYTLRFDGDAAVVHRAQPSAGADDWTHEAGGADNRFANAEQLVKWPLAALWYSGDIDRHFTPAEHFQHQRQPYPLVAGGRMFLITGQLLHAVDIYTGSYLWRAELPLTPWVQSRFLDSRVYGRPTERNVVAAADRVYAVIGEQILAYHAETGRLAQTFDIPAEVAEQARAAESAPEEARFQGAQATVQAAPLWTEVRLGDDQLMALLGRTLVALDRHTGQLRWTRPSTRETTTYALGGGLLFGLDCDLPRPTRASGKRLPGLLFALQPASGQPVWQQPIEYDPVPEHEVENPRPWLPPVLPELAYSPKHALLVMSVNRNSLRVFHAADGSAAWSRSGLAGANVTRVYSPVVTDDHIVVSGHLGCYGYLLDIRSGEEAGDDTGIPRPRTCARILGNNDLLVYRDAATELYDIDGNRMIGLNSLRSGCTTSFIPAGGIMTAPMLGHGCVCNYPMFASLGLFHWPEIEPHRPAAVVRSWKNQAALLLSSSAAESD